MCKGLKEIGNHEWIENRKVAIEKAMLKSNGEDIVLIAGKGS